MIHVPYQEFMPCAALAPYVQCYWTMQVTHATAHPVKNLVLPDGCIDIVLNDTSTQFDLVGAMRAPSIVMMSAPAYYIGIRFKPSGAAVFFDFPLHELTDGTETLLTFWRDDARRLLDSALRDDRPMPARIPLLEEILLRRLQTHGATHDTLIASAVARMQKNTYLAVAELATSFHLSERQFERRFQQSVGLTPKLFMRIMRFQRGITQWREDSISGALVEGYYDQSHFIRDFKAFTGITPSEYLAYREDVGFVQYPEDAP